MSSHDPGTGPNGAFLTIDLAAIVANWRALKARLGPQSALGAVVKADAYGLGVETVAPVLEQAGCQDFFVADLNEALALRRLLGRVSIYVLNGPMAPNGKDEAAKMVENRLIPVLNDRHQLTIWDQYAAHHEALEAVLHVDTGMNRLGLRPFDPGFPENDAEIVSRLSLRYIMSHLACGDKEDHPLNEKQRDELMAFSNIFNIKALSLANSAGIFLGSGYHFDLARAGGALYGLNPRPGKPNPLHPVVTLQSRIIQITSVPPPNSIGYGGSFSVNRPCQIATLAIGYADGYSRQLGNRGHAVIKGRKVPVVGRVSMDYTTLDISDIAQGELKVGDCVSLISPDHDIDAVAQEAGTIGYEILTHIGRSCQRIYTPV